MCISFRVKLGQDIRSGEFFAIKIIKKHHIPVTQLTIFQKILQNEVRILSSIHHPNVIRLVEHNISPGEEILKRKGKSITVFFIVLELVE